ncbi:hypothetical protein HMPREF0298_1488 [Corynebacterium lipophiloflavum DSM 44291]|uniref:Uncharacterized protein n=1 Tax=Corynebacterium lipophiloflavum (strain ATCC 700352 / DSM 44291 / CCUG 37336 / JCM 10383 / DMMZ 1944) TaxID=525263 RepID=C0XSR8_CORLD|nr:hypothetical protein HMPREF0298_1488 [Corynebacterium lipophiloflavum DSM 44291]
MGAQHYLFPRPSSHGGVAIFFQSGPDVPALYAATLSGLLLYSFPARGTGVGPPSHVTGCHARELGR